MGLIIEANGLLIEANGLLIEEREQLGRNHRAEMATLAERCRQLELELIRRREEPTQAPARQVAVLRGRIDLLSRQLGAAQHYINAMGLLFDSGEPMECGHDLAHWCVSCETCGLCEDAREMAAGDAR